MDSAAWQEDFATLRAEMDSHYANLDFAIGTRRMDLPTLRETTERRLREATTPEEAQRALRAFLKAFGDGHLTIDWPARSAAARGDSPTERPGPTRPAGSLCRRLGYQSDAVGGVDFGSVAGFTALPPEEGNDDFPGGLLRSPSGRTWGTLRISYFLESVHPRWCEVARRASGLGDDAACDDDCAERLQTEVANLLTAALERRIARLTRAGAQAIVVDLTHNGGGSDWVGAAARTLTARPISDFRMGAVRHAHWTEGLTSELHEVKTDLAAHGDLAHGELTRAIATLRREIAEVGTPCDKSALWVRGQPLPMCSQLVEISPLVPYARPGALSGHSSAAVLFGPSRFAYHEGASTLPLAVIVDGSTASAAEEFVEMLQDHQAAVVVGAPTLGAGCGFTNGGIPTTLPRTGAHVLMPDCARMRADGTNAVAGITPDVTLPLLERDSPYQRAQKIAAGLPALDAAMDAAAPPIPTGRRASRASLF